MNDELYSFALRNTLTEIRNACPDVSHTFIFNDDGKLVAQDEETDEETATRAADALKELRKTADAIGGLESATFYGDNNRVNVFCTNELNLALVTRKEDEENHLSTTLARIMVPTVLRLTEKIEENLRTESNFSETGTSNDEEDTETQTEEATFVEAEPIDEPEPLLPDPPVTQFMVENLGGLLVASDTVRVESVVIQQWKDLYGDREISEVDLETLNGQTARCKFKPIKDSKQEGKGVIQIPQKVQQTLQTSKGELIMVKPAIE